MGAKVATFEQCYNAEKRRRLPNIKQIIVSKIQFAHSVLQWILLKKQPMTKGNYSVPEHGCLGEAESFSPKQPCSGTE